MITAAIVLYNENLETLQKTIDSFLKTPIENKLFSIDNSPSNTLDNQFNNPELEYSSAAHNLRFGASH